MPNIPAALVRGVPGAPVPSASGRRRGGDEPPQKAEMAGYLLVPHEKVDKKYNAGFSMYVAAWPLLKNYPGQEFQSGLFGTWMFAQYDGPKPEKHYSDIEGGLGWWRDTRFATETPKFIMGGVALNFSEWANGPGAGKGRDWKKPAGHYAIAQLSPWVLWPPDGLNLKQGTCGELFGYGYLPLPLTAAKKTTAGKDVPTGNQCWTLFLNTGNFKGPVDVLPAVLLVASRPSRSPKLGGLFLDTRPSEPNKAVQMETQHVPAYIATDAKGDTYARIAPTRFPAKADGDAPLIHRITAYNKAALWDGVEAWFDGGKAASGAIDPKAAAVHTFKGKGGATWQIYPPNTERDKKVPLAWSSFATPAALDDTTYGYKWAKDVPSIEGRFARHPARILPPGEGQEGQGAVGGGERQGRAGRDRAGEGRVPAAARPPTGALRHARRGGELLEEAGAGGRAVRGEAGGRQRGDLLLVPVRRPARPAERRPDRRRAGGPPEAGGDAAQELDEGPRVPAARRRSASSPTSTRRCSSPRRRGWRSATCRSSPARA